MRCPDAQNAPERFRIEMDEFAGAHVRSIPLNTGRLF